MSGLRGVSCRGVVVCPGGGLSKGVYPIFHRGSTIFQKMGHPPHPKYGNTVNARAVRILLECILVHYVNGSWPNHIKCVHWEGVEMMKFSL